MTQKRIDELAKEFIIWGNRLDSELLRYYYSPNSFSKKDLCYDDKFFNYLLNDLDLKNEEYIKLTGLQYCHPDFEKVSFRLNTLLDWIYCAIETKNDL